MTSQLPTNVSIECSFFFQTKSKQQKIEMILTSKKIEFEKIDISSEAGAKDEMRAIMGDPKALAPQLINDDKYCGVS